MKINFIKLIFKITFSFSLLALQSLNANTLPNKAECKISELDKDNTRKIIVCQYIHSRSDTDKEVYIEWINPRREVDRARKLTIPAGHGSVFDYRYLDGRTKGKWRFVATDEDEKYQTSFEVK
jgi:hypothetical protein